MSCCPPLCLFHRPHPFLLVAWTAAENADLPAARANPTSDPPAPYKVTLGCPPLPRSIIEHVCRARPRFLPFAFPVAIAWCRTGDCVQFGGTSFSYTLLPQFRVSLALDLVQVDVGPLIPRRSSDHRPSDRATVKTFDLWARATFRLEELMCFHCSPVRTCKRHNESFHVFPYFHRTEEVDLYHTRGGSHSQLGVTKGRQLGRGITTDGGDGHHRSIGRKGREVRSWGAGRAI